MPEPLKNVYTAAFLTDFADRLAPYNPKWSAKKFVTSTMSKDWSDLELKDRMSRIAATLHEAVNKDYQAGCAAVSGIAKQYRQDLKTGFEYMFLADYVQQFAGHDYALSIRTLADITETGSAEFAIRPLIQAYPDKALNQLVKWTSSRNEHLRRLASEGCRPRLPWAMALPAFKHDPSPILPILEKLKNDQSLYVRRSVANNLNDISKDNPDVALKLAKKWLGQSDETDWLVKHACRGLLKSGHPTALELFGLVKPDHIALKKFKVPPTTQFGEALEFSFQLSSHQPLGLVRLEYAIDLMRANGSHSTKVFKISESNITASETHTTKRHKFVPITTRKYYPGQHRISILVNGVSLGTKSFDLLFD